MTRPDELEAKAYKKKVACGNLYITVSNKDGRAFEVFTNGSKLGGCKANQEGLSRLTSVGLQNKPLIAYHKTILGLIPADLKEKVIIEFNKAQKETEEIIIDSIYGIQCAACQRAKGEMPRDERKGFPNSCPDAIARSIKGKKEEA